MHVHSSPDPDPFKSVACCHSCMRSNYRSIYEPLHHSDWNKNSDSQDLLHYLRVSKVEKNPEVETKHRCESAPKHCCCCCCCCHFSPAWLWIFKQHICAFVNHREHYSGIKWAVNPPEWIEAELSSVLNRRNDSQVPGFVVTQPKCK